jgi:hypothetical protein
MDKSLYFSIFGGYFFESLPSDEDVLDAFQIPLVKKPSSSCKHCYGRFYTGFDTKQRHFILCSKCSKKYIDANKLLKKNGKK